MRNVIVCVPRYQGNRPLGVKVNKCCIGMSYDKHIDINTSETRTAFRCYTPLHRLTTEMDAVPSGSDVE